MFMFASVFLVAAIAAAVKATAPFKNPVLINNVVVNEKTPTDAQLCSIVPAIKRGDELPLNPPVCPQFEGPYSYICGWYPYELAADACAAYGWRLAMVTPENESQIGNLLRNCSTNGYFAWTAGVNGLPADPCAIASSGQDVGAAGGLNLGELCYFATGPVLCEEMPQVTVTETTTKAQYEASGETTTTTTAVSTETYRHRRHSSSSSSSRSSWNYNRRHRHHHSKALPPCYGQDCLPVCNVTTGGIHVLTGRVPDNQQASLECAKYGWTLLDYTNGRQEDFFTVMNGCFIPEIFVSGRINSYNGVSSKCPIVQLINWMYLFHEVFTFLPNSDEFCSEGSGEVDLIFCQEQCPFPVAPSGLEVGQVSLTTTTTGVQATIYTPTTTVVVTEQCTETVRRHHHH